MENMSVEETSVADMLALSPWLILALDIRNVSVIRSCYEPLEDRRWWSPQSCMSHAVKWQREVHGSPNHFQAKGEDMIGISSMGKGMGRNQGDLVAEVLRGDRALDCPAEQLRLGPMSSEGKPRVAPPRPSKHRCRPICWSGPGLMQRITSSTHKLAHKICNNMFSHLFKKNIISSKSSITSSIIYAGHSQHIISLIQKMSPRHDSHMKAINHH